MYGGDWPFALNAADSYTQIHAALHGTLGDLSEADRAEVLGGTARRVYRLDHVETRSWPRQGGDA
jgi:L-fuconolactonase